MNFTWIEKLLNIAEHACYSTTQHRLKKHPEDKREIERVCWECGYACRRKKA